MKNLFFVINKEKVYAYVVSILTIVALFFMSSMLNSELIESEETSTTIQNEVNNENNNLKYVRITGLNLRGNGDDLIKYKEAALGGITDTGVDDNDHCRLVGTYTLTKLLDDNTFNALNDYYPELTITQPTYTTIKFNNRVETSEKITNLDNSTGYDFGNDYIPSGYITKIANQRAAYMVKQDPENGSGAFVACPMNNSNNTLYGDGESAKVDGSQGDLCMYEPAYWYKGVNDHKKGIIYAMFSSL